VARCPRTLRKPAARVKDAPAVAQPVIRRSALLFAEIAAGLIAGVAIIIALLAWRLSIDEPLQLRFLTPYLEQAMNPPDGRFTVRIGATVLAWRGWTHALDLNAQDVAVYDQRGARVATVPEVAITLSGRALLRGLVAPQRVDIYSPRVFLLRDIEGKLHFMRWRGASDAPGGLEESPILPILLQDLADQPNAASTTGYFTDARLIGGSIMFADRRTGVTWRIPDFSLDLHRGAASIEGQLTAVVEGLGSPARVNTSFRYDMKTETVALNGLFANVDGLALGLIDSHLMGFGTLDMTLHGEISTSVSLGGHVGETHFSVAGGPGRLDWPEQFPDPLILKSMVLRVAGDDGLDHIAVQQFDLQLDGPRLSLAGSVAGMSPGTPGPGKVLDIVGSIALENLATGRIFEYWPLGSPGSNMRKTRDWVIANIGSGKLEHAEANFNLSLPLDNPATAVVRRFDGSFKASDVSVSYMKPMPPVRGVEGLAHFTDKVFDVQLSGGESAGLAVPTGRVRITGLDARDQQVRIEATVNGSLHKALELLDHQPLGYIRKVGLDPAAVEGRVAAALSLGFIAREVPRPEEFDLRATAQLTDVSLGRGMFGHGIDHGQLSVSADMAAMTVAGTADIEGMPLRISWLQNFKPAAFDGRIEVAGVTTAPSRAALGFDFRPFVDGPIPATAVITRFSGNRAAVAANLDLTRATMAAEMVNWKKAAGEPGSARVEFDLAGGRPTVLRSFAVKAGTLVADGSGEFAAGTDQIARLRLGRLAFAKTALTDVAVDLTGRFPAFAIGGGQIDATPLLEAENPVGGDTPDKPPKPHRAFELHSASLARVILGPDRALTNVAVALRHDGDWWDRILLDATLPGGASLGVRYKARADRKHDLEIVSGNAGAVLDVFGLTNKVIGGRLQISGLADDAAPDRPLEGTARITDFRLIRTPFLVRLLSIATLTGLIDVLTGEGFQFNQFESKFNKRGGLLTVREARAAGPSLGFTGDGSIDLDHSRIDMHGTIVPVYLFNNLLGNIPLIGNLLLGGKGEGIFAVTYSATGQLDQPDLSVNPLSMLAPGFLRHIFEPGGSPAPKPAPATPRK
jgi:hypothetical protein